MKIHIDFQFKNGESLIIPKEFNPRIFSYFPFDVDWWNYSVLRTTNNIIYLGAFCESLILYGKFEGKLNYDLLVDSPIIGHEATDKLIELKLLEMNKETGEIIHPKAEEVIYNLCKKSLQKQINGSSIKSPTQWLEKFGSSTDMKEYLSEKSNQVMASSRAKVYTN